MAGPIITPARHRAWPVLAIATLIAAGGAVAQTTPPAPVLSGNLPVAIPAHSTQTPEAARPFFDTFSWQSFVALMWPVTQGQRGVPLNPNDPATLTGAAAGPPEGSGL